MQHPIPMHVERSLRRWGNSYGFLVTRAEAKALGLQAGDPVSADLETVAPKRDLDSLTTYEFGHDHDLDDIIDEAVWEDHSRGLG